MSKSIDISVIIVNYNGAAFIEECLNSLFASRLSYTVEVIVVDNHSSDDSLTVLEKYEERILVIENDENTGFAYANNQALAKATGSTLFLLNNDTVIDKHALETMMTYLNDHPKTGMIAPKLLNKDGSLQSPGSVFGQWRFRQDKVREVPFIAGAAVLISRDRMLEMDGMDENLFFYNDDIDMCRFMKKHHYPIIYLPTASVVHYGGLSTKYLRMESLIEGYRGGLYLAYKHYGFIVNQLYRIVLFLDIVPKIILYSVFSLFHKESRPFLKGYLKILWINVTNDFYLDRVKKARAKVSPGD